MLYAMLVVIGVSNNPNGLVATSEPLRIDGYKSEAECRSAAEKWSVVRTNVPKNIPFVIACLPIPDK